MNARSPIFGQKAQEISAHLSAEQLTKTWQSYLRDKLRDSPIADPIENLDIHINISHVSKLLTEQVRSGAYVPRTPRRVLSEKSKGLCRQLVIPHPHDALILQCLSDRPPAGTQAAKNALKRWSYATKPARGGPRAAPHYKPSGSCAAPPPSLRIAAKDLWSCLAHGRSREAEKL